MKKKVFDKSSEFTLLSRQFIMSLTESDKTVSHKIDQTNFPKKSSSCPYCRICQKEVIVTQETLDQEAGKYYHTKYTLVMYNTHEGSEFFAAYMLSSYCSFECFLIHQKQNMK